MRDGAVEMRAKRNSPWLLVVPEQEMQQQLIAQAHNVIERGAHLHDRAIERQLRRKYWWWNKYY